MFQRACEIVEPCVCAVGSGRKLFGMGCLIANNLVLTARHVIQNNTGGPMAMIGIDGYDAELVYESEQRDVAALRLTTPIEPISEPFPEVRPRVSFAQPSRGVSVGYFGELHRRETMHRCFMTACLSFHMRSGGWALSGGFVESGFSGGPVFTSDGALCGVIIQMQQFMSRAKVPQLHTLPVVMAFAYLPAEFRELIGCKGK